MNHRLCYNHIVSNPFLFVCLAEVLMADQQKQEVLRINQEQGQLSRRDFFPLFVVVDDASNLRHNPIAYPTNMQI